MALTWVNVFESKEAAQKTIPLNTVVPVTIGNYQICLGRLEDGFFAIDDTCPHQQASLGQGKCTPSGHVECPFHHYLFDLRTGDNIGGTDEDVEKYPVKVNERGLFIGINE